MPFWSYGILGNDGALDALGDLGRRIGHDLGDLTLDQATADLVRPKLEALGNRAFDAMFAVHMHQAFIVGAAAMLHVGAAMDDGFKHSAFLAIDRNVQGYKDYFGSERAERRRAALAPLRQAIQDAAPGQRYRLSELEDLAAETKPIPASDAGVAPAS